MKFAHIFAIAAAAALFTVPAQADGDHHHGGFSFDASAHIEGGAAASHGNASGDVNAHGDKVDVKNESKFTSYSGEFKGTDCEKCGDTTHEFYTGANSTNEIHAGVEGHHDHINAESSTEVGGGTAIGYVSGGVSVSGHGHH